MRKFNMLSTQQPKQSMLCNKINTLIFFMVAQFSTFASVVFICSRIYSLAENYNYNQGISQVAYHRIKICLILDFIGYIFYYEQIINFIKFMLEYFTICLVGGKQRAIRSFY